MHAWEEIEKTLDFIEENLSEEIETKTLADKVFLSPFYFQRLFKRVVKKPVHEYIKQRRLAKAVCSLRDTEDKIIDIALSFGFSNHGNFTRAFKEAYKITPEEYRQKQPRLNVIEKPNVSSQYILIDEGNPLIIGEIVLEIAKKTLDKKETFIGIEGQVTNSQQLPVGESTGIDDPGELWKRFYEREEEIRELVQEGMEIGMSRMDKGQEDSFSYFVGKILRSPTDTINNGMVKESLQEGDYIVCKIEAESKEKLVTIALDQAYQYLFGVWLPKNEIEIEPFSLEKYITDREVPYMELWLKVV